jgi:hypothetical protein
MPVSRLLLNIPAVLNFRHLSQRGWHMKRIRSVLIVAALLFCAPAASPQVKPCEELKSEIEAKLKKKGVTNYTLEIVPADQVKDQKIVGSCNGGKNKITYTSDKEKQ